MATKPGDDAARSATPVRQAGPLLAILAGLAVLAAGCGGGSSSSAPGLGSGPGGSSLLAGQIKFAQCMRARGISGFPDPSSGGSQQTLPPSVNVGSPQFQSAQKACQHLSPGGGTGIQVAGGAKVNPQAALKAELKYVGCMRTHGVPDMPDPSSGGGLTLPSSGSINPQSTQFQTAQQACQKDLIQPGGAP